MRQVSGSGLVHSSAMLGTMERSLKLMLTSPSNTLYITRLPWMSERITGLRLPNSPPHVPTRRSRLPCAIAGARPVPSMRPVPSAPAPKPRRVMPRLPGRPEPFAHRRLLLDLRNPLSYSFSPFSTIWCSIVIRAACNSVGRAVDVGDEAGIGPVHRPAGDARLHDPKLRCLVVQYLAVSQMTRQCRRDAVGTPVRHRGEDQDITFSNRANAAMAGTAAVLAEGLDLAPPPP